MHARRWGDSGDANYGDVHFYDYASDCLDPATYPRAKFVSEFGYQSWPSWPIYKGVTQAEDWSRASAMSQYRWAASVLLHRCCHAQCAPAAVACIIRQRSFVQRLLEVTGCQAGPCRVRRHCPHRKASECWKGTMRMLTTDRVCRGPSMGPKRPPAHKLPHACRMRHPDGIAELEQQLRRHFHLPRPGQAPSTELFQQFIYLTQAS